MKKHKGFTMTEVIISLALVGLLILSVYTTISGTSKIAVRNRVYNCAVNETENLVKCYTAFAHGTETADSAGKDALSLYMLGAKQPVIENPDGENPDGENPDGENPDGENPAPSETTSETPSESGTPESDISEPFPDFPETVFYFDRDGNLLASPETSYWNIRVHTEPSESGENEYVFTSSYSFGESEVIYEYSIPC